MGKRKETLRGKTIKEEKLRKQKITIDIVFTFLKIKIDWTIENCERRNC